MTFTEKVNPEAFRFKQFSVAHDKCAHKVGTDGVLLGAWIKAENPKLILDIGSGSGLISFMLAQRFPKAKIIGIELDPASYEQSLSNLANKPWKDRIQFIQSDFLKVNLEIGAFDLIVSNPPFFKQAYLSGRKERDQARHEFSLPHDQLIAKAEKLLSSRGKFTFVLPSDEAEMLIKFSTLNPVRICRVQNNAKSDFKRMLVELQNTDGECIIEQLAIRNHLNSFSSEYQNLTRDFYLNF